MKIFLIFFFSFCLLVTKEEPTISAASKAHVERAISWARDGVTCAQLWDNIDWLGSMSTLRSPSDIEG